MSAGNDREFIDELQRKEGRAMKCPFRPKYKRFLCWRWVIGCEDCLKEECAWWNKTQEECNLVTIAVELFNVSSYLNDIRDKMPHELQFRK